MLIIDKLIIKIHCTQLKFKKTAALFAMAKRIDKILSQSSFANFSTTS